MSELITRKSQDNQFISKFVDQLVHLGKIPYSCSSERGYILHKYNFPLKITKINFLLECTLEGRKLMKVFDRCWASQFDVFHDCE